MDVGKRDQEREYIEQQRGSANRKFYVLIFPFEEEIWVDFHGLPLDAFLCAGWDGIETMKASVGKKAPGKPKEERLFVRIEWVIKDWDGDKEIAKAVERARDRIMDNMEEFRKQLIYDREVKRSKPRKGKKL